MVIIAQVNAWRALWIVSLEGFVDWDIEKKGENLTKSFSKVPMKNKHIM